MPLPSLSDWAVRSGEPETAQAGGGALLLSLREQKYFSLNASAAAIWQMLETPVQLCAVRDALVDKFGAPPDEAAVAVQEFVARLVEQNVVRLQPDISPDRGPA